MPNSKRVPLFALISLIILSGCGLRVPEKDLFSDDNPAAGTPSSQGMYEETIVANIRCEIRNGVWKALQLPNVQWLATWGATVTLKITTDEQSALNPGVSLTTPLENSLKVYPVGGNVNSGQSFALGLGLSGSAHATRVETIQFTYSNAELLAEVKERLKAQQSLSCDKLQNGVTIQSDLKIGQFIYDKTVIAATGEATSNKATAPPYSTFQEELTFVASFGGNGTPTWKFARASYSSTSPLVSATRSSTNDVIISMGKVVAQATKSSPAQLSSETQAVHNSALTGSAVGTSINSQTH